MDQQQTAYAIKEAALIFEAGLEKFFDYIIGVTAPESVRLERVMERDKVSADRVLQRMKQQMDEKEKISRCDFVIQNNGIEAILPQVLAIHETLLAKAKIISVSKAPL
jgi:dephospho-CoA kinase